MPPVSGTWLVRIQQLEVPVETKTNDNVIVNVSIADASIVEALARAGRRE